MIVIASMQDAIEKAAKTRYGAETEIRAEINPKTGELKLTRLREVVESVEEPAKQIDLKSAQERNSNAKLGDFEGLDPKGAPRGLLFPASLVRSGQFIYVTNLSLDLRVFGLPQTVDSQWTAKVKQHTIARIHAHLPPVRGL